MKNPLLFFIISIFLFQTTSFSQTLNVSCMGYGNDCGSTGPPNGFMFANVSGGTAPYIYQWSTGAIHNSSFNSDTLFNLTGPAIYTVTVTDGGSATGTCSSYLFGVLTLDLDPDRVALPLPGTSTGVIMALTYGNNNPGPLTISLHNITTSQDWGPDVFHQTYPPGNYMWQAIDVFDSLPTGQYHATITNGTGCTGTFDVFLPELDTPVYHLSITTTPSCANLSFGTIKPNFTWINNLPYSIQYFASWTPINPNDCQLKQSFIFGLYDSLGSQINNHYNSTDTSFKGLPPGNYNLRVSSFFENWASPGFATFYNSYPVTVAVNTVLPTAQISYTGSPVICTGNTITLNANTGTGMTYAWTKANVIINGETTSSLVVDRAANYKVIVTKNGCSKTSTGVTVSIAALPTMEIVQQPDSAGKDAVIESLNPSINFGNYEGLETAYWGSPSFNTVYGLIDFDKSAWPSWSKIRSARLSLYGNPTSPNYNGQNNGLNASKLYRVIAPWNENTVTWYSQPNITSADTVGLAQSTQPVQDYLNIDVSEMVRNMSKFPLTGYGFMLKLNSLSPSRSLIFCSSDHPVASKHPKLVLTVPGAVVSTNKNPVICLGDSVKLTVSAGFIYAWQKNGVNIAGANSNFYYAKQQGNYKCIVSNAIGCSVASQTKFVQVNSLPTATITPEGPTTFCAGDSVILKGTYGTNLSYQWKKNTGNISGATNRKYTAKTAGSYTVKVTTINGCTKLSAPTAVSVPCRESGEPVVEEFSIEVYPNPTSGDFNFRIVNALHEKVNISIYDVLGQLVRTMDCDPSLETFTVNLPHAGFYKARIISGTSMQVVTLIKTD